MAAILHSTWKLLVSTLAASRRGWGVKKGPNFLIIGAQKAGTSALHAYLSHHPNLVPAVEKEIGYFCPEAFRDWTEHRNYSLFHRLDASRSDPRIQREGLQWYHSKFPSSALQRRPVLFYESTPDYLYFSEAAKRISDYASNIKLIVLLRNPVERAFSAWNMFRNLTQPMYAQLRERRSFEDSVRDEMTQLGRQPETIGTDYVRRGLYHQQISRFLEYFPTHQIHFIESRSLKADRLVTLNAVCRFLDVPLFKSDGGWPLELVGSYASEIPRTVKDKLRAFYAPHNAALYGLIGCEYDWN